jgi:nicotinamide-nucleotide amidase
MFNVTVMPWVMTQRGQTGEILSATFKIYNLTESKLDDLVKPIDLGGSAKLSFRVHFPDLTLRLTVSSGAGAGYKEHFVKLRDDIRAVLGTHVYAEADITMEEVVGRLLLDKHQTLALAESCTGGLISHRITRIAGSSAYYLGGAITYANEAKMKFLGVETTTLEKHGAVSEQTALEMSRGIKERTGASLALSVTGIAGPSGGSPAKPVGTVWMSVAAENYHNARLWHFHGERERIITSASQAGLNWLRLFLLS